MTVKLFIGRRVPKRAMARIAQKIGGILSFQEYIWLMIKSSFTKVKKKMTTAGIYCSLKVEEESEDLFYNLQWIKVEIQGTKEQEEDEYKDCQKMYDAMGVLFKKKEVPKDANLAKHFKSKILDAKTIEDSYRAGHGAVKDRSIADKLLEMGILTSMSYTEDWQSRTPTKEVITQENPTEISIAPLPE